MQNCNLKMLIPLKKVYSCFFSLGEYLVDFLDFFQEMVNINYWIISLKKLIVYLLDVLSNVIMCQRT